MLQPQIPIIGAIRFRLAELHPADESLGPESSISLGGDDRDPRAH